jgi:hypothetical protein
VYPFTVAETSIGRCHDVIGLLESGAYGSRDRPPKAEFKRAKRMDSKLGVESDPAGIPIEPKFPIHPQKLTGGGVEEKLLGRWRGSIASSAEFITEAPPDAPGRFFRWTEVDASANGSSESGCPIKKTALIAEVNRESSVLQPHFSTQSGPKFDTGCRFLCATSIDVRRPERQQQQGNEES